MASKPKNHARRVIDSRGAHFRIDTGNPQESLAGPEAVKVYAVNDKDDSVRALVVVAPERAYLVLSSDVPHGE